MLREADKQGGTLAETDLSLILSCSLRTIHKNIDRYLGDFERVHFCLKKGLSAEETAFAAQPSKSR